MTKSTKKKLIAIGICFVILVASILSNTIAYFSDEEKVANTFVSGNVEIKLDEAVVVKDAHGDFVTETGRTEDGQEYGTIYPGMKITKDPTITNIGVEDAYLAAKVDISGATGTDIVALLSGGALDSANATFVNSKAEAEAVTGDPDYIIYKSADTVYIFVMNKIQKDGTVELFETLTIPTNWDNDEITLIKNLKIDVTAYGIQTYGFDNGYDAAMEAFGDSVFNFA